MDKKRQWMDRKNVTFSLIGLYDRLNCKSFEPNFKNTQFQQSIKSLKYTSKKLEISNKACISGNMIEQYLLFLCETCCIAAFLECVDSVMESTNMAYKHGVPEFHHFQTVLYEHSSEICYCHAQTLTIELKFFKIIVSNDLAVDRKIWISVAVVFCIVSSGRWNSDVSTVFHSHNTHEFGYLMESIHYKPLFCSWWKLNISSTERWNNFDTSLIIYVYSHGAVNIWSITIHNVKYPCSMQFLWTDKIFLWIS